LKYKWQQISENNFSASYWYCITYYADPDVRLARRIKRDTVERGRDVQSVLEQARFIIFILYNILTSPDW